MIVKMVDKNDKVFYIEPLKISYIGNSSEDDCDNTGKMFTPTMIVVDGIEIKVNLTVNEFIGMLDYISSKIEGDNITIN